MVYKREKIASPVIRRLPRYYRFLQELERRDVVNVSSGELAELMRTTASQVRQDLNCFGEFGQHGIGYRVETLRAEIGKILGIGEYYPAVIVGAGNIGTTMANQILCTTECFNLVAIFDNSESKIGSVVTGLTVRNSAELEDFCTKTKVTTGILCVPREAAEEITARLYNVGIRSFWNFSHYDIMAKYPDTLVENVHLNDSLMALCFRIKQNELASMEEAQDNSK